MSVRGPYLNGSGGQVGWEVTGMMAQPPDPQPQWNRPRTAPALRTKFVFCSEDWVRMAEENNLCALILSGGIPQSILDEWMLAAKLMHQ